MKNVKFSVVVFILVVFSLPVCGQHDDQKRNAAAGEIEKIIVGSGDQVAINKLNEFKSDLGGVSSFGETEVAALGAILQNANMNDEAIKVFNLALDMFPDSMQIHLALSSAYKISGDRELEIKHFQTFTKLRYKKRADEIINNLETPPAKTAEDVFDRYLNAIGGKEKIESIDTKIIKVKILNIGRVPAYIIRYFKRPNLFRQEVMLDTNSSIVTVINESGVWRVSPDGWQQIEGDFRDNLLHGSTIDGDFIDYSERGITYDFHGIEGLRAITLYKIVKTYKSGATYELFFNVETNLLEMERYPNPNGIHQTNYYDYADVGGIGILTPRVAPVSSATLLFPPYVILTEEVQINVPLDDSLFKKPE